MNSNEHGCSSETSAQVRLKGIHGTQKRANAHSTVHCELYAHMQKHGAASAAASTVHIVRAHMHLT